MSTVEENKKLVIATCEALDARDVAALLECVHDDGSWSIPYRQNMFQFAGFRKKADFGEMIAGFLSGFTDFSFKIVSMIAEGDRVSIEARSEGTGPGTATYKNIYHVSFLIQDGKHFEVREFFDPFEVLAYVQQWPAS